MVLAPTGDRIVVRLNKDDQSNVTASGIYIPKKNQEKESQGEVVAIGPGRILDNGTLIVPAVAEGDKVIFNKFAGTELESGDEKYLIIHENDILAIIKE